MGLNPRQFHEEKWWRGGDLNPDAQAHYASTDRGEASQYGGNAKQVQVDFANPLHVQHERGVSWRSKLEETAGGKGWLSHLQEHDGIIYHWHNGKRWAIGRPGTMWEP